MADLGNDEEVEFPERVPGPRMSALPSELQPVRPRPPRPTPEPGVAKTKARRTERQKLTPKTGLVYADWGVNPSPMKSLWKLLIGEYRLAAHYWRFRTDGKAQLERVKYADEVGVWWRYFPSNPEAFDATDADLEDRSLELAFRSKYAPFFWSAGERLYHREQFLAVDEIASVMCNPLFALAAALSPEMVKRVQDASGEWFYEGRGTVARAEVEAYGREIAGWVAGFLGVSVTMRNVTAATPHLSLYEDVSAPVLQRARTCPVPRPPAYAYGCLIPLAGLGKQPEERRGLFLKPKSILPRTVKMNGAVHMGNELGWTKDDSFERNVEAMGMYVPEVMFGATALDVDAMRDKERKTPYEKAWAMLGALALDSLSARFSVGRAYLAGEMRNQASHAANFDPSMYANAKGKSAARVDDVSYAADGKLFSVSVGEDWLGLFDRTERINMYTFGYWLRSRITMLHKVAATSALNGDEMRAAAAVVCMERFAAALETDAYDVRWWNKATDARKVDEVVKRAVNGAAVDVAVARRTLDRLGELLAVITCAVVRCGLEVWVMPEKKNTDKMMVVVGGNPACALTQGRVYANVAFLRPGKKKAAVGDAVRGGTSSVKAGDGETPSVNVRAESVMRGNSEKGRYVRLEVFSLGFGESRMPADDKIVAHERGPTVDVPDNRTGSRSAAGQWGARWTQWKSLGIFTVGEGVKRVVFLPELHPWKSGVTVLDKPQPPVLGEARVVGTEEFVVEPYDRELYTLYHVGSTVSKKEWEQMWASVTKAMEAPLTVRDWRLLREKVPLLSQKKEVASDPAVVAALTRLGQTFGFVDPLRTTLAMLTKTAGNIGSYDSRNISRLDVQTAEKLVRRQPGWAAASISPGGLPGTVNAVPSVFDYLVPLTKRVERVLSDGSTLAWNYYVDLKRKTAEVFVCDVCVKGPLLYWQEAWRASAGENRGLFGRGLVGVEKLAGPTKSTTTTFHELVPRDDPAFDTSAYDEAVSLHGHEDLELPPTPGPPRKTKSEEKCSILGRAAAALKGDEPLGSLADELRDHLKDVAEMYKRVQVKRSDDAGIDRPLTDRPESYVTLAVLGDDAKEVEVEAHQSSAAFDDSPVASPPPAGATYTWEHDLDYYATRAVTHIDLDDVDF